MREGFDGRRVDDADSVTRLVQKERERPAVSAGGLQTGVDSLDALLGEPLLELLEAGRVVRKDFMFKFAVKVDETNVELQFGDVDAQCWFCHGC